MRHAFVLARVRLHRLPSSSSSTSGHRQRADFHVRRAARDELALEDAFFSVRGDVVFADLAAAHRFAGALNAARSPAARQDALQASQVNAMGLVHEVLHVVVSRYVSAVRADLFSALAAHLRHEHGAALDRTLVAFVDAFPPPGVYRGGALPEAWLAGASDGVPNVHVALEEMLLAWLTNENPAYAPIGALVTDADLRAGTSYIDLIASIRRFFDREPRFGPSDQSLVEMLLSPIRHAPGSLFEQLEFMRRTWGLDVELLRKVLLATDFVKEEGKWFLRADHGKPDDSPAPPVFRGEYYDDEPERFSADRAWMPRLVMVAKSTFVWLDQLSRDYGRPIRGLGDVPDEELERLAARGFTGLWLIGIWKRSAASLRIKQRMGNADAIASAYSLADYEIAAELGGWEGYQSLRERAVARGVRLASDMVPNHMGLDSRWVVEHPDWFVQTREPPFPNYSFNGPDLCDDSRVGVVLEDGYWSKSDAAVVFKRFDRLTGDARYIYHGNDGTSMPWNDTAQLDYTKHEVREAVIQTILHVARMFPIIRFDAAMTLAKRHYQRLWFPVPGSGGDIPSRAALAIPRERFEELFPVEFWREVVDRVAAEVPDTLLLAEAFWMMEGFFVRTLGMHRVYNSAFMNMLKKEDNAGYRATLKNVVAYNPQILKRYVNFMNNPDEDTAIAQFGRDDKYFGVCTLMCTMPGLPMFGHGQIEGFTEKYGMEYRRARLDEAPDAGLLARHEREIFPLLHARALFSDVERFTLYDVVSDDGKVDEDVFAYSNARGEERVLVVYHNKFKEARGWIRGSVEFVDESGEARRRTLGEGLALDARAGTFSIFRDHTSGLELIRDNAELGERGLYVELGAFKYHVFWRFRQVVHSDDTPWAELVRALAGRGVPSMDDALADLRFAALHDALSRALAGADDALRAFVPPERLARLDARLSRAARLVPPGGDAAARARWLRAWAMCDALGAPFDAARLSRPIENAWREAGAPPAAGAAAVALVRLALRVEATDDPRAAMLGLLDDPDARAYLGVNTYGGVEWLRKEPFEVLAAILATMARVDAPASEARAPDGAKGKGGETNVGADGAGDASGSALESAPSEEKEDEEEKEEADAADLAALAGRAGYRVDGVRELLAGSRVRQGEVASEEGAEAGRSNAQLATPVSR
jgi:glycosidase